MESKNTLKVEKTLLAIIVIVATLVALSWLFKIYQLTDILPNAPTMKFNTAVLFIMAASAVYLRSQLKEPSRIFYFIILSIISIVSLTALVSYSIKLSIDIDNAIIEDSYSKVISGRMSRATAINFLLFAIGLLLLESKKKSIKRIGNASFLIVLLISVIGFVSFILMVPIDHKIDFFESMSIVTSTLFILLTISTLLTTPYFWFKNFITNKLAGSRLIIAMLPFILFMPILLNYFLIYSIKTNLLATDFAIVLGAVLYMIISLVYIIIVADSLNHSDYQRKELTSKLTSQRVDAMKSDLLKETHHRVKNNFQMVNSILTLQAKKIEDQALINVIEECQDRIRAMAALHENMYSHGDYEEVLVKDFFQSIVHSLVMSYSGSKKIEMEINIDLEKMDMNTAIPLGLIINEMVTNSLKHAFSNRDSGTILLELREENSKYYKLVIGDDGVGSPIENYVNKDDNSFDEISMGRELIEVFTEQISGRKKILDRIGTVYKITFPKYHTR
ncbi:sensor histidine kinase [Crocinitomix catalasitica]|uniref:sensor histidine kinase n=1 Tax=Crocinitomix catalasitica TaxID=184607 RepID=UPI0006856969|nr:sensor histidine kinase [Crocinitomix catalasitica]